MSFIISYYGYLECLQLVISSRSLSSEKTLMVILPPNHSEFGTRLILRTVSHNGTICLDALREGCSHVSYLL